MSGGRGDRCSGAHARASAPIRPRQVSVGRSLALSRRTTLAAPTQWLFPQVTGESPPREISMLINPACQSGTEIGRARQPIGGRRGEPVDVDAFDAALEVPAEAAALHFTNRHQDHRMTRRNILIGAAASVMWTPAIVRATSLMPVHRLRLPIGPQYAEFCRRLFYHSLDSNLRTGSMCTVLNGKIIPEADARRMVAYARAHGWLPPEPKAGDSRDSRP